MGSGGNADNEDKYAKCAAMANNSKPQGFAYVLSLRDYTSNDWKRLLGSPCQLFLLFLLVVFLGYFRLGGDLRHASSQHIIGCCSCIIETFGLLTLRYNIMRQGSANGVSGASVVIYFLSYVLRELVMFPPFSLRKLDLWMFWLLQAPSVLLTLDAARLIFVTYKDSYQSELDVLKPQYIVLFALALAVPCHPELRTSPTFGAFFFNFVWTTYMYMDVLALLPQVVMMARGDGQVHAPIAHFVAATTVSRVVDLWFWYYAYDTHTKRGWLIIVWQVLGLMLVADFMYYYVKARLSGAGIAELLDLSTIDDRKCWV